MRGLDRYLQRLRIDQVRPYVSSESRVLDIGCADGAFYKRLGPLAEYVGIDPEAREEDSTPSVRFIRSTFPSPDLQVKGPFDVVTALAILEHVPPPAQAEFALACASYLRPQGLLVVTVPSPAVDSILAVLKWLRLLDGMHDEQHYGYKPQGTAALFSGVMTLERHVTFELGLNHLFVFRKGSTESLLNRT